MKILPLWAVASTVHAKFDIPDFEFPEQVDVTDLDIESADYIRQYGKIIHDNDPRVARQGFFFQLILKLRDSEFLIAFWFFVCETMIKKPYFTVM